MGDTGEPKNDLIKQIFETMEYGNDLESVSEFTEWLKSKQGRIFAFNNSKDETPSGNKLSLKNATNNEHLCDIYIPDSTSIEEILSTTAKSKNAWNELSPIKKSEIISKLAVEIQKQQDVFTQLEIAARGILSKDTKNKALPLLTDCLHYYSSFSVKYSGENPSFKPKGLVVAIVSDSNSLSSLGYILGPCLASGHQLIFQTGPQLSLSVKFLIELTVKAGIPEGTIKLIPGDVDPNVFLINSDVSVVAIFDDLYKEKYIIANNFNKKIIHFNSSGSSVIVFDSCDLDSACHSVVDAAFACKGMLPWSVRRILVQENVFDSFLHKLKNQINQIKIGKSNQKNIDISYPSEEILTKLQKVVTEAKSSGIDVYQATSNEIYPSFLIGGNLFPNNVIKEDYLNIPVVTIVPFRSSNEAVSLTNNSRQGLGVSVWTENTSLINEIIGKLKFGNTWINSCGLFAANISFSPYKTSGNAFFGGKEGFYEYIQTKTLRDETIPQTQNTTVMEKAITEAKKGQETWSKLSEFDRITSLQKIAQNIENNKSNWSFPENWLNEWVTLIHEYVSNHDGGNFIKQKNFNILSIREPCGVVAVEILKIGMEQNKRLIISALSEANAVIILTSCENTLAFYNYISKNLPNGVLTIITHSVEAIKVAALHKELDVFIGEQKSKVFFSLPLKSSDKFKIAKADDWIDVQNKITLLKTVWFNKGQSII